MSSRKRPSTKGVPTKSDASQSVPFPLPALPVAAFAEIVFGMRLSEGEHFDIEEGQDDGKLRLVKYQDDTGKTRQYRMPSGLGYCYDRSGCHLWIASREVASAVDSLHRKVDELHDKIGQLLRPEVVSNYWNESIFGEGAQ